MDRGEWLKVSALLAIFLAVYFAPMDQLDVHRVLTVGLDLLQAYAREHVLLCLVPAFLIAGAMATFIDRAAVMRYLGPSADKPTAYAVSSVSGGLLAVCSCTILPLFAGIVRMGAGIGPASTFLYAGPAINVLAVIFSARVLGPEIALARAVSAIVFSLVIGLLMAFFFASRSAATEVAPAPVALDLMGESAAATGPSLSRVVALIGLLVGILIFANWGPAADPDGFLHLLHAARWYLVLILALPLLLLSVRGFGLSGVGTLAAVLVVLVLVLAWPAARNLHFGVATLGYIVLMYRAGGRSRSWFIESWGYAKQIAPLLLAGVFISGVLLGRPGSAGLVPASLIASLVGGNGLLANFGASLVGALMYFATLTEVPILEGLIGAGMGQGPALALLLAGPALSLPNMLVIASVIGARKTLVYVAIVVVGSTLIGLGYGAFT